MNPAVDRCDFMDAFAKIPQDGHPKLHAFLNKHMKNGGAIASKETTSTSIAQIADLQNG